MNSGLLVMKFGGTSVGSAEAMSSACQIVESAWVHWENLIVVTSALSGVTDQLLKCANDAISGDPETHPDSVNLIRERHLKIANQLITDTDLRAGVLLEINTLLEGFQNLCNAIRVLGEATPRALDAVASLGEKMSARLLTAILQAKTIPAVLVDATSFLVTDEKFQQAHPDMPATANLSRQVILPYLQEKKIPVITGFIGATPAGTTTTLGRGGSDYSAAIIASAVSAREVWICTDVDGVMSADPRIVPDAKTIPNLSYKEVAELAYFGAKVLHPKTIRPIIEAGIELFVRNTFNHKHPGTQILKDADNFSNGKIKAVTLIQHQALITVEGRGMLGVPGVAARTFSAVASTGTSVPLISQASSEQSICFAVPLESIPYVIYSLESTFAPELFQRDIDRIWASEEVAIVTVVGAGMRHTPGIAGRVFTALGENQVNVIAIAQGSSEVSISLVVDGNDAEAAVQALHKLIQ